MRPRFFRCSLERLQGGLKTTALYKPPTEGDDRPAPSGGGHASSSAGQAVDGRGVPRRRAGVQLSAWLWWGSLTSFDSALATHALQPTMRKHFTCPGCGLKTIGSYDEIKSHLDSCGPAQSLAAERREQDGYGTAQPSAAGGEQQRGGAAEQQQTGVAQLDEYFSKAKVKWGRRRLQAPDVAAAAAARPSLEAGNKAVATGGPAGDGGTAGEGTEARRHFACPVCGLSAEMTPVQILLHRKGHQQQQSAETR